MIMDKIVQKKIHHEKLMHDNGQNCPKTNSPRKLTYENGQNCPKKNSRKLTYENGQNCPKKIHEN
jgi:hypothetical protein